MTTTPTLSQQTGIDIKVFTPLLTAGGGSYIEDITDAFTTYGHEIALVGGYVSASFTLTGKLDYLEDWLLSGLARHIAVYGNALDVVWEGFVNSISLTAGGRTIEIGPLMDVVNRAGVVYNKKLKPSSGSTAQGNRSRTALSNNLESQAIYGILQTWINGGELLPAEVTKVLATYIKDVAWPKSTMSIKTYDTGSPSLTVNCLGYYNYYSKYTFNNTAVTDVAADVKLKAVMNGQPNALISTDYSNVNANATLINQEEKDDRTALDIIETIVSHGDATDNRWQFGIYASRKAFYKPVVYSLEYLYRSRTHVNQVESLNGSNITPWNVLPGKWLFNADLLVGKMPVVSDPTVTPLPAGDARLMLIESVSYTAPNSIELAGGKSDKISQLVARLGIGGI